LFGGRVVSVASGGFVVWVEPLRKLGLFFRSFLCLRPCLFWGPFVGVGDWGENIIGWRKGETSVVSGRRSFWVVGQWGSLDGYRSIYGVQRADE